ncbi:MAG: Gx transporter family protein [Treponema sp.]|jgi:heptaprenyl diphosphate synthase|nr:Gx transporter family protein [Treponema sp.]
MLTPRHGRECQHSWHGRHSLALLGSLCFFLSTVEYLIPKPLPFMRLGLANMPLLLALDIFGPGDFFLLLLLKILGQGLIGGMIFSHVFLFSIAGTISSGLLMFGLRRLLGKNLLGFAGLGCAGAMASNSVQLLLARYLIFGPALRYLTAPFLVSGLVTGIGLGLVCEYFCRHSLWYSQHLSANISRRGAEAQRTQREEKEEEGKEKREEFMNSESSSAPPEPARAGMVCVRSSWNKFNAEGLVVAGLLMALIFLFNRSLEVRIGQFLFFCLLALVSGKKINLLATALFMVSIVFFHLLAPFGKVLAVLGPLRITEGSLNAGIDKALIVSGLVILSRISVKSDLKLPGTIGSLLGESLRMLELIRERRGMIKRNHIISGLDKIMLEMETIATDAPADTPSEKQRINGKSILLLCAMVLITLGMNLIVL